MLIYIYIYRQGIFAMSTVPSAHGNEHCRACMSVEELMDRARKLAGKVSSGKDTPQSSTTQISSVRFLFIAALKKWNNSFEEDSFLYFRNYLENKLWPEYNSYYYNYYYGLYLRNCLILKFLLKIWIWPDSLLIASLI